jgi:omega-hydroxy-beta-dihydromenaquinone-9 sulfotransferase
LFNSNRYIDYMFDFPLAFNLMLHAFSFKKGSLRYPTPKRLFNVLITLPLFFLLVLMNRILMAMDHILFPSFKKLAINKAVFITGVPRSATTYQLSLLAKDRDHFTCFKLWEIFFAPSIIQKYFFGWILKIDRLVGRPLYRMSTWYDKIALGKIARLHDTGLSSPEEDEMLLIHAFASVFLIFCFPEVPEAERYIFFDEMVPAAKRKKIMHFYKKCVQRHVYYHSRDEKKIFLSKNPSFISKTTSLAETFPQAKLIYMLRSPLRTIPSTINLNNNLYSFFSGEINANPLEDKTKEIVVQWYKMADHSIAAHWQNRNLTMPFGKITKKPAEALSEIYTFLKLTPGKEMLQLMKIEEQKSLRHATTHQYNGAGRDENLMHQLEFIFQGPYRDEL